MLPAERLADGLPGPEQYRVELTLDHAGPHAEKRAAHALANTVCDDSA